MAARPFLDVGALPDFAHIENYFRFRKAIAVDQLLYALAADAEHATYFRRPNEMMHSHNASGRLTSRNCHARLVK
jgi:hypothetical protein